MTSTLAEWLSPGPRGLWLAAAVAAQVAAAVLVAWAVSRLALRRRPAARHRVWLCALACVFLGPAAVVLAEGLGLTLPILPRPRVATGPRDEPPARPPGETAEIAPVEAERGTRMPVGTVSTALGDDTPSDPAVAAEAEVFPASPEAEPALVGLAPPPRAESAPARVEVPATDPDPIEEPEPRDDGRGWRGIMGALTLLWLAGVLVGLAWLAEGWRRLARLRRSFRPFDVDAHAGVLGEVRDALGTDELPPIVTSPGLPGPAAVGVLRPVVVLPEGLEDTIGPAALRDVLVHECAHVLRRDARVGLLQRMAAVLYWPHPLVHALNAQLARAREEVCDNFVLRCGDPCGYARTLLALTERRHRPAWAEASVGLTSTRWTLTDRIAGLLDPRRDSMTTPDRRGAWALGLTLFATTLGLAAVRPADPPESPPSPTEPPQAQTPTDPAPARTVRGLVVDEAGRPVAGATVFAAFREKSPEPATTDAEGRFTLALSGFMLTTEDLIASSEGDARLGVGRLVEPENAGPAEPVRIVLKPSRAVAVHVRDGAGKPVAGASVEAVGYGFHGLPATTDEAGDATLRIPPDAEVRSVIGLKPGVGFDYFENYRESQAAEVGPTPNEVTLVLDGARTARIHAVDSSGRPVQGVEFRAWVVAKPGKLDDANIGGAEIVRARTDERGVATFAWLPPKGERALLFLSSPGAYSCPGLLSIQAGDESGEVDLNARLLRNTRISGVARDAEGRPAAGILLRAEGRGPTTHYCRMHTRTGEDGSYHFDVNSEQSYMVAALDDRRATRTLTGVVVREGRPVEGLDLTLVEGTVLRGRVTRGPDDSPVVGESVGVTQRGAKGPEDLFPAQFPWEEESLIRWATTDADGRYQIRLGPGEYTIAAANRSQSEGLTIADQREVVRDFQLDPAARRRTLSGVAVEATPAGERPIPRAVVETAEAGGMSYGKRTLADESGRFAITVGPGRGVVFYVRDAEGTVAGFTTLRVDAGDLRATATPASRIRGRVVDGEGKPRAKQQVGLRLDSDVDREESGSFYTYLTTDGDGRYEFRGVVVGAKANVSAWGERTSSGGQAGDTKDVAVLGPDPIDVPDLVVREIRAEPAKAGARAAPRGDDVAPAAIASRALPPTRAELEEILRSIGRDPVTPELVDRAWLRTRPHFVWSIDLARLRSVLADPAFVERADAASQGVFGHPADAVTLLAQAINYRPSFDAPTLESFLRREQAEAASKPMRTVEGRVLDGKTRKPIAGAVAFTDGALTRTDESGRFRLETPSTRPRGIVWVEAEGYATAETPALADGADASRVLVEMIREATVTGRVVGPDGEPIAEAIVRTYQRHYLFRIPTPVPPPIHDSYSVPFEVATDADGRYAIHGLPPWLSPDMCDIRHPEFRTLRVALKAGEPGTHRMEAGCNVSGAVVDDLGRPIPGAQVAIRRPGENGDAFLTHTADDGRFRFGAVDPGRWTVLVQPGRHAPLHGTVVASEGRPVENQYVAPPGAYVSGKVVGPDGEPVPGASVGWAQPKDADGLASEGLELNRMSVTARDGTFRLGPLPQGEFLLRGVAVEPRREGQSPARANQTDVVIRLAPDPQK